MKEAANISDDFIPRRVLTKAFLHLVHLRIHQKPIPVRLEGQPDQTGNPIQEAQQENILPSEISQRTINTYMACICNLNEYQLLYVTFYKNTIKN